MNALAKIPTMRLPNTTQRTVVIGRTGSGKTTLGFWLLTLAPFDRQPYVIIDYKGDDLLNSTDRIIDIGMNEIPKQPGLYRISPIPETDDEAVENWLHKVWLRENVGLYADEGYLLPNKGNAFNRCLTQGRSKHIPVICLTQRPSWISRFVFSEADFIACMQLNEKNDRKRVQEFIPADRVNVDMRLPDYHSHWYDVGKDNAYVLRPVPDATVLTETMHNRLKPKRRLF